MKYKLLFILIFTSISILSSAQNNQAGTFQVSLGYGTPSIIRAYLKLKTTRDDYQVFGSGPYMVKCEYLITNRMGISLNGAYSQSRIAWQDYGYDTIQQIYRKFEFGIRAFELSGVLRWNYHFIRRNKLDMYAGAGFGYGYIKMNSYTYAHTTKFSIQYQFPRPLSLESTVGLRYFPLKNLGFYTEAGLGKSWILFHKYFLPEAVIQTGIVYKFNQRKK